MCMSQQRSASPGVRLAVQLPAAGATRSRDRARGRLGKKGTRSVLRPLRNQQKHAPQARDNARDNRRYLHQIRAHQTIFTAPRRARGSRPVRVDTSCHGRLTGRFARAKSKQIACPSTPRFFASPAAPRACGARAAHAFVSVEVDILARPAASSMQAHTHARADARTA